MQFPSFTFPYVFVNTFFFNFIYAVTCIFLATINIKRDLFIKKSNIFQHFRKESYSVKINIRLTFFQSVTSFSADENASAALQALGQRRRRLVLAQVAPGTTLPSTSAPHHRVLLIVRFALKAAPEIHSHIHTHTPDHPHSHDRHSIVYT